MVYKWIQATDFEHWSDRRDAQEDLPRLVRKLIHSTVDNISKIDFPAGDSIQYSGWDGVLSTQKGNEFVPDGFSVWEFGTNKNINKKANSDYQKRCEKPLGLDIDPSNITYVFVTSRRWSKKSNWIEEKNRNSIWKKVIAYDADELEQWLELSPSTHVWFARKLNKWSENIQTIDDFWFKWTNATRYTLSSKIHLIGRDEQKEAILNWLKTSPSKLTIKGRTNEEVVAFFSAVIYSLNEEELIKYLSRSIYIKNNDNIEHIISAAQNNLIIIASCDSLSHIPERHHVLITLSRENNNSQEVIELPNTKGTDFFNSLTEMGLSFEEAEKYTQDSKSNIFILRRLLAKDPELNQPKWSRPEHANLFIPILLIGGWDGSKNQAYYSYNDYQIIEKIASKQYQEYISSLKPWLNVEDTPIRTINNIWQIISYEDSWKLLSHHIFSDDLNNWKNTILDVLKETDPKYGLPPKSRLVATLFGKKSQYSNTLKDGIVTILALLASEGIPNNNLGSKSIQSIVDEIVYELLNTKDWEIWATHYTRLPILAEASPDVFLECLDDFLSDNSHPVHNLLKDNDDFWGANEYVGILWALETLAWNDEFLPRVCLCLATFNKIDIEWKLANRPFNSLKDIFFCYNPKTSASLEQILQVIDLLFEREPDIAFKLVFSLLPDGYRSIGSYTQVPKWRNWKRKEYVYVSPNEYIKTLEELINKLLANLVLNDINISSLIDKLTIFLPKDSINKIFIYLDNLDYHEFNTNDLIDIQDKLRKFICKHIKFQQSDWSFPLDIIEKIYLIYKKIDSILENKLESFDWLFSSNDYESVLIITKLDINNNFYEETHGENNDDLLSAINSANNYDEEMSVAESIKINAVETIYKKFQLSGILELIKIITIPRMLGRLVAKTEISSEIEEVLIDIVLKEHNNNYNEFARGFITGSGKKGWDWINNILSSNKINNLSLENILTIITSLPFNKNTWNLLEKFSNKDEIENSYWKSINYFWGFDNSDIAIAVEKFLEFGRPITAICFIGRYSDLEKKNLIVNSNVLINSLKEVIYNFPTNEKEEKDDLIRDFNYYVPILLNLLDYHFTTNKDVLAELEWLYLPFLLSSYSSYSPKNLHFKLSTNSSFFFQVFDCVYPQSISPDSEGSQEDLTERAKFANDLLDSWRKPPGLQKDGTIDFNILLDWVNTARASSRDVDKIDFCIGKMLAYSPSLTDNSWSQESVWKLIEKIKSKKLEEGIQTGIYNQRGVWTKSLDDGGLQERKLADIYQDYANQLNFSYPRTSRLLKKISENYISDADREDLRRDLRN